MRSVQIFRIVMTLFASSIATANAAPVTSAMYQSTIPDSPIVFHDGASWYLYFEAMQTTILKGVEFRGQPATDLPLNSNDQIRWQLFQATSTWQTPNGNDDRLFSSLTQFPENLSLTQYMTPIFDPPTQTFCGGLSNPLGLGNCPANLVLQQGSYYFLSLQITGPDNWFLQSYLNSGPGAFLTTDGLFLVDGYNSLPFGPSIPTGPDFRMPPSLGWSLITEAVPEPVTLSVFGSGLIGAIAMCRRKKTPLKRQS